MLNKHKVQLRMKSKQEYLEGVQRNNDSTPPNIVFIFADDMGHMDLSCYGSKAIKTPNIDNMASMGVKLNNFYASSPVCSPSRFSALTGRYPTRGFIKGVFFPKKSFIGVSNVQGSPYGVRGILPDEITIADALKAVGYKTSIFGKWHLGDTSPYLPTEMGFDYFYGSYYSNDMNPYEIYQNDKVVIKEKVDQNTLTAKITDEICGYIDKNKNDPFFIYYPSPFPHHPVHASEKFSGKSLGGSYGDCVEELDWSVGKIMEKLDECGQKDNTLIIFSSDNGPWFEGSPGLHRGRKGNSFDGGQIVPFIAALSGKIDGGREINNSAMNIDLLPTILKLAGVPLPSDREIDGVDIMPLLAGKTEDTMHDGIYFVDKNKVKAVRTNDDYKFCIRAKSENARYFMMSQGPFLFNMNIDVDESYNVINRNVEMAKNLQEKINRKQYEFDNNPRGWLSKKV